MLGLMRGRAALPAALTVLLAGVTVGGVLRVRERRRDDQRRAAVDAVERLILHRGVAEFLDREPVDGEPRDGGGRSGDGPKTDARARCVCGRHHGFAEP